MFHLRSRDTLNLDKIMELIIKPPGTEFDPMASFDIKVEVTEHVLISYS